MNLETKRVAAIAVAKDEGAYLADWVFHHLHFGFSPIFIGVNRTSDNSIEILTRIAEKNPDVHIFEMDWLDQVRPHIQGAKSGIQVYSYSYMVHRLRTDFPDVTHALPTDIDEYWFPADFKTPIPDWIKKQPQADITSVHWINQMGEHTQFAKPFAEFNGAIRKQVKTIINLRSDIPIKYFRPHVPDFVRPDDVVHLDAAGDPFQPRQSQSASKRPEKPHGAYILHRWMRSEQEYFALLGRMNLHDANRIKDNRDGFYYRKISDSPALIDRDALEQYWASMDTFIEKCDLAAMITKARQSVLKCADILGPMDQDQVFHNIIELVRAMQGTSKQQELLSKISSFKSYDAAQKKLLTEAALSVEGSYPKLAAGLLELAE